MESFGKILKNLPDDETKGFVAKGGRRLVSLVVDSGRQICQAKQTSQCYKSISIQESPGWSQMSIFIISIIKKN